MKHLITFLILTLSMACFGQENAESRTEKLSVMKSDVEAVLNTTPFKSEEHTKIKAYFVELGSFIEDLQSSSRYRKRFNRFLRNTGVETFCQAAYLEKKRWNELVKNCTMNNFFLCTEEVKIYPENKTAMRELVDSDNKAQLETLPACQ